MFYDAALALLKTDLGRTPNVPAPVEDRMLQKLEAAESRLARMGIHLDDGDYDDLDLLVMYAAYLYEKERSGEPMPRMLRDTINDRKAALSTLEAAT